MAWEQFGQKWLLEAQWNGVVVGSMKKFEKDNTVIELIPVPELTDADLAEALQEAGDAYDYGGLFGVVLTLIGKRLKKKWKNPWNNTKAVFCSELLVLALQKAKFPGIESLTASETTPEDLLNFLQEHRRTYPIGV